VAHPVFDNAEKAEREAARVKRQRMRDHSKGEWSIGKKAGAIGKKAGAIVTDQPVGRPGYTKENESGDIEYYGGHVICESIAKAGDAELLAAAPKMYAELLIQMQQAWQRADYRTADRIADILGEPRPTDHEKAGL
jgi:hypothetical protein